MKTTIRFKRLFKKNNRKHSKEIDFFSSGEKHWLLNGRFHREDGPAIEWSDGVKYWYLNGNNYSKKQYQKALEKFRI